MRVRLANMLLVIAQWLVKDIKSEVEIEKDDPANVIFISPCKDGVLLKLREFVLAYESCNVDCIAAVIKYKRTNEQIEDGEGSIIDFISDWEDDHASTCIGIINRLLVITQAEAYGYLEEEELL